LTKPLKIAVAGLGTVGTGLVRLVRQQAEVLESRCARPLEVVAVSARKRDLDRGIDLSGRRGSIRPKRWRGTRMRMWSSS
jgi:homoserine dehydrogenase